MARWSVQIIGGKRTELLGYVRAADERKGSPKPSKSLRSQPTGGSHYRCSGEHWMVPAAEEGSLMARWRVDRSGREGRHSRSGKTISHHARTSEQASRDESR